MAFGYNISLASLHLACLLPSCPSPLAHNFNVSTNDIHFFEASVHGHVEWLTF